MEAYILVFKDSLRSEVSQSLPNMLNTFFILFMALRKVKRLIFEDSSKSSYEIKSRCVIAAAIFITVINCMVNFVTTFMCFSCFEIIYNL